MKNTQSYKTHYQTLNVRFDCNWKELRTEYKKAIQKWHPDRFKEGTEEKSTADEKIKAINYAYNCISRYYRENDCLPTIDANTINRTLIKETSANSAKRPIYKKTQQKYKKPIHHSHDKTANYFKFFMMTVSIGAFIYFSTNSDETSNRLKSMSESNRNLSNLSTNVKNNNHIDNLHNSNKKQLTSEVITLYFKEGSTISDVINAQGLPAKTDGDIWFYGDSEIHFEQGKVTHWIRSKGTPLNAQLR